VFALGRSSLAAMTRVWSP